MPSAARWCFVGANDGFLHAFDAGVWGRDTANFPTAHRPRARAARSSRTRPRIVMSGKFPNLLSFPPLPQYFVDGSMGTADVFIDPVNDGVTPNPSDRVWRTVLVGGLRQGGAGVLRPRRHPAGRHRDVGRDRPAARSPATRMPRRAV